MNIEIDLVAEEVVSSPEDKQGTWCCNGCCYCFEW
jgi:hypothetical protein